MTNNHEGGNDHGGWILGACRLQELHGCSINQGFGYDNVGMEIKYDPMRLVVDFNSKPIGLWTRTNAGVMVADFGQATPFTTESVVEASDYTLRMCRKYQKRHAKIERLL